MKSILTVAFCCLATAAALGANRPALIPTPQKMEVREGVFELQPTAHIYVQKATEDTGRFLAARVQLAAGWKGEVTVTEGLEAEPKGSIKIMLVSGDSGLGAEGYRLDVSPERVQIKAADAAGAFYGVQSLLQLLPPQIFSTQLVSGVKWEIPCVQIQDQPRFAWRGFMLDVARHFFTKQEVKRVLDSMAMQKLNTFHWHLVDDQGWRIEIKKYPRLTEVGAWRKGIGFKLDHNESTAYGPDGRYGGFYTQADIREVVAYAQSLHITIVPEIEMPGHAIAALSAYPQFSCSGKGYTTDVDGGVFAGVYCPGKEETFAFLEDVLSEVFDLFPGRYVHIGGDEVPKENWKACALCQARRKAEGLKNEHDMQSYFTRRIETYVNAHHRTLIGWSEIREGGLAKNAAIMDWIGGAVEAASDGHDVVMSPTTFCYFDYCQATNLAAEPHGIGGFIPLKKVYAFDPLPLALPAEFRSHILGGQGNLWTEYIPNLNHVQYMMFPRLLALSEATWSPKESRNWEDFLARLPAHFQRLDQAGINYRHLVPDGDAIK